METFSQINNISVLFCWIFISSAQNSNYLLLNERQYLAAIFVHIFAKSRPF